MIRVDYLTTIDRAEGRVIYPLVSSPIEGRVEYRLALTYEKGTLEFMGALPGGGGSTSINQFSDGKTVWVLVTGWVQPRTESFLSLRFGGEGQGQFAFTITEFQINGEQVVFDPPPPVTYDLTPEPAPPPAPEPPAPTPPAPEPELPDAAIDFIAGLYVSAFGRAHEFEGAQYWHDQYKALVVAGFNNSQALKQLARDMYWVGEQGGEPGTQLPTPAYVDFVYQQTLGRNPDAGGRSHWVEYLQNNPGARAEFVADFMYAALTSAGPDGDYVRARIDVAEVFSQEALSGWPAIQSGLTARLGDPLAGVFDAASASARILHLLAEAGIGNTVSPLSQMLELSLGQPAMAHWPEEPPPPDHPTLELLGQTPPEPDIAAI